MLEHFVEWFRTHASLENMAYVATLLMAVLLLRPLVVSWIGRRRIAASERREEELRQAKERERIEAMEAAMTLPRARGIDSPLFVFTPEGLLVPDLSDCRRPFVLVRGKRPASWGTYCSAYVDVWEESQDLHRIEVEVTIPEIQKVEEDEAMRLPLAEGAQRGATGRAGFVQIQGANERIVTCIVAASGSAKISELRDNGSGTKRDHSILQVPAGSFPANGWHTVVLERTEDGCNIRMGEGDRWTANSTIQWPSAVNLRLGGHSTMLAPMAWFTKPRVS